MPPKTALRRPAGAGPIGHRAVRGGAGAQALARAKAGVRRPASAAEETRGVEGDSEIFQRGEAVEAYKLPLETWKSGTHIAITKGIYWEEEVQVAGRVEGLATKKDQVTLSFRLDGTKNESLVKWSGSHPGVALEVDICQPGCSLTSKDGLLHCQVVQKVLDSTRAAWMNNLVAAETPMGAEDGLRRLRLREKELAKRKGTEDDKGVGEPQEDTLSGSSEDAKKKRKKKKKKDKVRVVGTKSPAALFATTALDPKPEVRRRVRRRARRLTKRRNKKESTGSSGSSSVTSDTGSSEADGARLFGEEVRIKKVWRKSPGALTLNTLEQMQLAVVTTSGQMWDLDRSSLPPIFSQYWKLALQSKMSGPLDRESQTLCFLQDLLLQGKVAAACDVVTQRLKGLEQISAGGRYSIAQRQELVPLDFHQMTTATEALEASRIQREELKAKSLSSRPWEKKPEWEKRSEEPKGKGKTKDKGKLKGKGDRQAQGGVSKEDREKK